MENKKVMDLVTFADHTLKAGWGYVWGAGGEIYTMDIAKKLYETYGTAKYNSEYYLTTQMQRWGGRRVADCSGLIQAFRGVDDTANGLLQKCKQKGLLSQFEDKIGSLVFCVKYGTANHVGIMASGGYVIHSTSSNRGVIKEKLNESTRGWTHYGIPSWIEYKFKIPILSVKKDSPLNDICWLQQSLNIRLKSNLDLDGEYGMKTAAAVLQFRKSINDWKESYIGMKVPKRIIKVLVD